MTRGFYEDIRIPQTLVARNVLSLQIRAWGFTCAENWRQLHKALIEKILTCCFIDEKYKGKSL
ncbi:MAG: hypothetical protein EA370_03415 [Wenzhouxiangella sp.]|nr:MAG: hypothetical protein EA370_03415 [Wenzhouxiangella sp.]